MDNVRITIEGKKIDSEEDFYCHIVAAMGFPDYYGKNLDALWDCLTDCILSLKHVPVTIEWKDHLRSKLILGEEFFGKITEQFYDLQKKWKKDLVIELD